MKKKTAYLVLFIVCLSFYSFGKKCNNVDDETSFKKGSSKKSVQIKNRSEWNLAPCYNFLAI
ncbi:MAG TPA: hypothetical protein VGI82_01425 [Chitinophagaceae bacterium]|jgi:hypothetical protein